MSETAGSLVIDARPRTQRGLLASELVSGRPVLTQILEAAAVAADTVFVHARIDEHETINGLIPDSLRPRVKLHVGPPPEGMPLLRTDRLYDPQRLRKVLLRSGDPERAVLWRLDGAAGLAGAEDELIRRRTYQPLGRFWAFPPARKLAETLKDTPVRPNAVTLAATCCVLLTAILVAMTSWSVAIGLGAAVLLAVGLILDTADGHLARIQGTASEFGRWLDATLDEAGDMALHAAIAWGAYQSTSDVSWLVVGMLYGMGKYAFFTATIPSELAKGAESTDRRIRKKSIGLAIQSAIRLLGHADVRWHLWILCAALGWLRYELVIFAAYYPFRLALVAARKVVTRAV